MKHIITGSLLLLSSGLYAASISGVEHGSAAGGYQLVFKNAGVKPAAFNTDSSIVLDFPNTTSSMKSRGVDVASNGIYNVDVIPGQGRTRAVINLSSPMNYNVSLQGQDVIVSVTPGAKGAMKAPVGKAAAPAAGFRGAVNPQMVNVGKGTATIGKGVNTVGALSPEFKRTSNGRAAFTFNLPSPDTVVNIRKDGNKVVADVRGITIANSEQKRLDVTDYNTPVSYAEIKKGNGGATVSLNMAGNPFEFVSYQSGNTYTIEIMKPAQSAQDRKVQEMLGFGSGKHYKGEPLSLNFQDIEVRAVLQIIAEFTRNNIVVSDGVTGNITLRLDNVPWDQALDIIMKTKGLDKRQSGDVIYVATLEELRTSELTILRTLEEKKQLTPTRIDRIQVQFARATDLKKLIDEAKNNVRSTTANGLSTNVDSILSEKGSVSVDERTNTLIVNDIPEKIQAVRDLVAELDKPVKQVLIDSRIVLTEDNYARDLGSRFGVSFINRSSSKLVTGSGNSVASSVLAQSVVNGERPLTVPDLTNRLGVNMPVIGGTSGNPASYGLSILSGDFLVDLELSALQTEGRVEIVSSPRVVTQDGAPAEIWSGVEVPIVTRNENSTNGTSSSSSTTLETVTAALRLSVTPRIAPNNMVDMELNINNDELGNNVSVAGQTSFTKNTSGVKTNVLVDNGETIVLGGVYKQRQTAKTEKVPLLGDIPVIGNAFKKNTRAFEKNEMLIFVTPRIVDKQLVDNDKFSSLRDR
ncbi:type IV pilus secretin PilQ [Cardiobacterium hominis]|jgi:type IV pilus secretin pilQ|nr:type IV pilus secretin PilQ [Cardiobacterium hominis]SAM61368.1 Type IV pilus biogenesis protein PilQ [Cardiobacterium hominis]VEG78053.1 Type IV pilus biogenesis and competence protein pilQ precursor [Cardiobacterium hominis]